MKMPDDLKIKMGLIASIEETARAAGCGDVRVWLDAVAKAHTTMIDALAYIYWFESQVPRWISVEEQPEPSKDGEYYCYGYWFGSGRKHEEIAEYLGEWKIVNNFVLTHWMQLPEPPKEQR